MDFLTKKEIETYLSGDKIQCLLCGKKFKMLGPHLNQTHEITADEYRDIYGLPYGRGLCCKSTKDKFIEQANKLREEGKILTGFVSKNHKIKTHKKGPRRITPLHSKDRSRFMKKISLERTKYLDLDFDKCWELFNSGMTQKQIGKKFGVGQMTISRFMRKANKYQKEGVDNNA